MEKNGFQKNFGFDYVMWGRFGFDYGGGGGRVLITVDDGGEGGG